VSLAVALGILGGLTATSGAASGSGTLKGTIQMITGSAPGSNSAFVAVNKLFEKKYPHVKVVYDPISNANYATVESTRLTAHNIDILEARPIQSPSYASSAQSDDAVFAAAGGFVNLSHEPFEKRVSPSLLKAIAFEGKDYTFPTGLSYETGVFYNKAIFAKYNLSVPTTWTQFVTDCQTLQAAGVTPLGIGGADGWPPGLIMLGAVQGQYPSTADKNALAKGLWKGKVSLTDSQNEAILDQVQQAEGFAEKGFAGVAYDSIPANFAAGDYAMTVDGTWDETTIAAAVGSNFQFGYFPLPTGSTAASNAQLTGKTEIELSIASSSKNRAADLAYLNFFSTPAVYKTFVKLSGFAPVEPHIPSGAFLNSISKYTTPFVPAWDQIWTPNPNAGTAATFPFDYPDIAPQGTLTAAGAAAASEQAWQAGL
jgi:raffinose/stachyose/melibiose transport system substrate-binding protein